MLWYLYWCLIHAIIYLEHKFERIGRHKSETEKHASFPLPLNSSLASSFKILF